MLRSINSPIFNVLYCIPLALLACLAGCDDGQLDVYPVTGHVTLDGERLTTGSVTFVPEKPGPTATGIIQHDGTYKLTTYEEGDGAVPGSYKVMVAAVDESWMSSMPEQGMEPLLLVPDKYSRDKTSGLSAVVEEQDRNVANFELVSEE